MKITVNKDNVKIEEFDVVHEGEHRVNKCSFSFSEEYTEELVKKAIFTSQNSSVEVAIINNECDIPTEILKARNIVLLGVYAYKVVDDKLDLRYSPSPDAFKVNSGSYIEGASESEEITPSQFEQYMQALNDGLNKVEESIKKMGEATSSAIQLVDDINQKLENGDFIGPQGPQGIQGIPGKNGTNGQDGIGISTIISGQPTIEADKTITPVTVNKTDGSSQSFKVEAKNGLDGQNGQDGQDGVNGQNGQDGTTPNIQIGTVETLEPNEQAMVTRTGTDEQPVFNFGIPQGQQGEQGIQGIPGEDGQPGQNGVDGKDATINGQNTVEITTDNNITLEQQESVLNLGLNSQLIPKQDAEGTDNTITDALDMNLFALGGDGKSEQETTTGKNKFDTSSLRNRTQTIGASTGNIYTLKPNTQYTVSTNMVTSSSDDSTAIIGTPQSANAFIFVSSDTTIETISSNTNGVGTINNISRTLMTDDTGNIFVGIRESASSSLSDLISKGGYVQIEEGPTATSYEPYTGGQPSPSPDYPQEINSIEGSVEFACRGKNLFDFNKFTSDVSNVYTVEGTPENFTIKHTKGENGIYNIDLKEKTQYIISGKGFTNVANFNMAVVYTDGSNSSIVAQYDDSISNKSFSVKTTEGKTVSHISIFLYGYTKQLELKDFMISQDLTDTNYVYQEPNEVTFNLNDEKLRSVGDVKDELVVDLETGDYYKVENIGEVVFDGSDDENWVTTDAYEGYYRYICKISNDTYNTTIGVKGMNNYFTQRINQGQGDYEYLYIHGSNAGININIQIKNYSDIDQFKQWLSTHNTIVNYILKTPTTNKLGTLSTEDLAKLKTFKGYNNVTVNTNLGLMNIRFTYGLDIKKYVDNKLAEISAQLIKGE